jgi:hypothetical protein
MKIIMAKNCSDRKKRKPAGNTNAYWFYRSII